MGIFVLTAPDWTMLCKCCSVALQPMDGTKEVTVCRAN